MITARATRDHPHVRIRLAASLLTLFLAADVRAQEEEEATLELLLDAEVGVATRTSRKIRETPGVVTLVTRDEIAASGARDLEDVLALVPGFAFGSDVGGVVGIGFRGIWGHEGKVLLRIDGVEMNETLYSTLQWERHYPADAIERVEIIRGPGSAVHGGYAELAVIDVITRRPEEGVEGFATAGWGQMEGTFGRRRVAASAGAKRGELQAALHANVAQGVRSARTFTDFEGDEYSMADHSGVESAHLNGFVAWKGAELRVLHDDHRLESRGGYGTNFSRTYLTTFQTTAVTARWAITPFEGLQLTPHAGWKRQLPWRVTATSGDAPYFDKTADRFSAGLTGALDPTPDLSLLVGIDGYRDAARLNGPEGGFQVDFDGEPSVEYDNGAAFAQALWDTKLVNVAAGARYERHSEFGDSFVPRLGLTRTSDIGHVKLLAARAFRAPGIENVALNPDIRPERTTVVEAELGYRVTNAIYAAVNVFDVTIEDPIIYGFDETTGEDSYTNFDRTGTRGVELQARLRTWQADAAFTVSFYSAAGKNEVPVYEVEGHEDELLGLAPVKLTAAVAGRPVRGVRIGSSVVVYGPRHGFLEGDATGVGVMGEEDPAVLFNLHVTLEDVLRDGLSARVGLHNVAGTEYRHLQPFDGANAPLPAQDRELLAELSFAF